MNVAPVVVSCCRCRRCGPGVLDLDAGQPGAEPLAARKAQCSVCRHRRSRQL